MKHFILGGARSGKSRFAEQWLLEQSCSSFVYVATATAGDEEMQARIAHHQQRRGEQWQLVEEPLHLDRVLKQYDSSCGILIDCLTLWLSNALMNNGWPEVRENFITALKESNATICLVSNEVGQGIVPMGELSRQFVDESGWLHQELAQLCHRVSWVVAGLPQKLK